MLNDKSDIAGFIDYSDLGKKIPTLTTKSELKAEQGKIVKLEVFGSSYFCGKSHFKDDGTQNYLVFQGVYKYFRTAATTNKITAQKCNVLSDENIKLPATSDNTLNPEIYYFDNAEIRKSFDGCCLKQEKVNLFNAQTSAEYLYSFIINRVLILH